MKTTVALRYTGPAVDSGTMDVYEASGNMIAFSEFAVLSAKYAFGESSTARAEVSGFRSGSFTTELIINVGLVTASILSSTTGDHLWQLIKESFSLWKHLKGSPPTSIQHGGQQVTVTNNDGQVINVNFETLHLVMSDGAGESVSRFVQKALGKEGMDSLELLSDSGVIERVTQDESGYFVSVATTETITDNVIRMILVLESPVFKEGNKWRFSDGQNAFHANIEDREFLARVNAGERFGKDDVLEADVRLIQRQTGTKIDVERSILKVHDHRLPPSQLPL